MKEKEKSGDASRCLKEKGIKSVVGEVSDKWFGYGLHTRSTRSQRSGLASRGIIPKKW
jgi:hypothetical protein